MDERMNSIACSTRRLDWQFAVSDIKQAYILYFIVYVFYIEYWLRGMNVTESLYINPKQSLTVRCIVPQN